MSGFALVLSPSEAAEIVDGWPPDAWLVAAAWDGGAASWDACGPDGLADLCAGRLAWPPAGLIPAEDPGPCEEMALLLRVRAAAGVADGARARMAPPPGEDRVIHASEIEW